MLSFFIAGTPSNARGFDMSFLDQKKMTSKLIREWSTHIDSFVPQSVNDHKTVITSISVQDIKYSLLVDYRGIDTAQQTVNRGAYISAGAVCSKPLTLHQSIRVTEIVSEIHAYLEALRGKSNSFAPSFRIEDIEYSGINNYRLTGVMADSLCDVSRSHPTQSKLVFNADSQQSEYKSKYLDSDNTALIFELEESNRNKSSKIKSLLEKIDRLEDKSGELFLRLSDAESKTASRMSRVRKRIPKKSYRSKRFVRRSKKAWTLSSTNLKPVAVVLLALLIILLGITLKSAFYSENNGEDPKVEPFVTPPSESQKVDAETEVKSVSEKKQEHIEEWNKRRLNDNN